MAFQVAGQVTPNEHGLYECPDCGAEYDAPLAAALCCEDDDPRSEPWPCPMLP